jgi:hypothetical protein
MTNPGFEVHCKKAHSSRLRRLTQLEGLKAIKLRGQDAKKPKVQIKQLNYKLILYIQKKTFDKVHSAGDALNSYEYPDD